MALAHSGQCLPSRDAPKSGRLGYMETDGIIEALRRLKVPHERIAEAIGQKRYVATKMLNGQRKVQARDIGPLMRLISETQNAEEPLALAVTAAEEPAPDIDYAVIQALPAFPGAPVSRQLFQRALLEALGARPQDLRLITVRGDAMAPMFLNGDGLLIDVRDRSAAQGGPFALWIGPDDYAVRLVQRLRDHDRMHIQAVNPAYPAEDLDAKQVRILGRPVWLSRRL